jgi:hypothetical protein
MIRTFARDPNSTTGFRSDSASVLPTAPVFEVKSLQARIDRSAHPNRVAQSPTWVIEREV